MTTRRPTSHNTDESPFRRWSRRKHRAREEGHSTAPRDPDQAGPPADEAQALPSGPAAPEPAGSEPPRVEAGDDLPTDADMPPIEALGADSDYSQFMSPRVSASLRRMALRKLFGTGAFNLRDGLDDYDEDFTRYQSLGDTITADMKFQAERRAHLGAEQDSETTAATASADASAETDDTDADEPPENHEARQTTAKGDGSADRNEESHDELS